MKRTMPSTRLQPPAIPQSLPAHLDVAVLEAGGGAFRLLGKAPRWLGTLWPESAAAEALHPESAFPYLDYFMEDARAVWAGEEGGLLRSDPWMELDREGREWTLQATAMRLEGRRLLLISFPMTDFETVRGLLQEARNQGLQHHRLLKEIDKREVLLHCIIHDLSTPLAGIKGSLTLLRDDGQVRPEGEGLLRIGLNQVEKMQRLIREILATFSAEVQPLLPTLVSRDAAPDLAHALREVAASMRPVATLKDVRLRVDADPNAAWRVAAEPTRLERVLFNLVENALRHTRPGAEIRLCLEDEGGFIRASVEDEGEGVPEALVPSLFEKFAQGGPQAGKMGLGLYFCRLTVEDWGGTIGYEPRPEGGARFWFRLPRPPAEASGGP
ncbi:sensor histidine kinase [Rhodocaloribacter sp.]